MADHCRGCGSNSILQKEPRLRVSLESLPQSCIPRSFSLWMFTWLPSQCNVAVGYGLHFPWDHSVSSSLLLCQK